MKNLIVAAACVVVLSFLPSNPAQAVDRTAWQAKAETAVHNVVTDSVADKMQSLLYSVGKNTTVKSIVVEPDGNGVLARISMRWSGFVIAVEYNAVIRWRFNANEHVSSTVESAIGLGVLTDKDRLALDDYLRKELYPKVQAEAAK
jgi:hypothetical protein